MFQKLKEGQYESGKVRNEKRMVQYKIKGVGRGQIIWNNADPEKKTRFSSTCNGEILEGIMQGNDII